jgi:hypothetical protein
MMKSTSTAKIVDFADRLTDVEATRKKKTNTQIVPGRAALSRSQQNRNNAAKNAMLGMSP